LRYDEKHKQKKTKTMSLVPSPKQFGMESNAFSHLKTASEPEPLPKPKRRYTKRAKIEGKFERGDKDHCTRAYRKRKKLAGVPLLQDAWRRIKGRWEPEPKPQKNKLTTYFKVTEEEIDLDEIMKLGKEEFLSLNEPLGPPPSLPTLVHSPKLETDLFPLERPKLVRS